MNHSAASSGVSLRFVFYSEVCHNTPPNLSNIKIKIYIKQTGCPEDASFTARVYHYPELKAASMGSNDVRTTG